MKKGVSRLFNVLAHLLLVLLVIRITVFANLRIKDSQLLTHKKITRDLALAYDTALFAPQLLELNYSLGKGYKATKPEDCLFDVVHSTEKTKTKLSYYCTRSNSKLELIEGEGSFGIKNE